MRHDLSAVNQLFKELNLNQFNIGELIPASLMLQELEGNRLIGCSYMNSWGCDYLQTTVEEINQLGEKYYEKYFYIDEIRDYIDDVTRYIQEDDCSNQYNFFQRVKRPHLNDSKWFYTVCKLLRLDSEKGSKRQLIVLSSPVEGISNVINRVNKTLNLDGFIYRNYKAFLALTPRERDVLSLIAQGKSTNEMASILYVSPLTISTHRRNLIRKTKCQSSVELLRFAIIFEEFN